MGSAYPQVAAVTSMPTLDAASQETNSMSTCPSSAPGYSYHLRMISLYLHASGIWAPTSSYLHNMQINDQAIICCVCSATTEEQVNSQDLLDRMQLDDPVKVPLTRRLTWHNHVECSDSWLKKVQKLNPIGDRGCDRHNKKTWS